MACGAGTVKAEAVANRQTTNAAWVMSLLAREQVHFAMACGGRKKRTETKNARKKKTAVRDVPILGQGSESQDLSATLS